MTTAESMAVAVLKGDLVAARALADLLMEEYQGGAKEIPVHKRKLTVNKKHIRAAVFLKQQVDTLENINHIRNNISDWLSRKPKESHVIVCNAMIDRIELYELPHGEEP